MRRFRASPLLVFLTALGLLGMGAWLALPAGASHPSVTGSISGPSDLGESLSANYTIQATGGPAEAANGTTIGTYAYNASLSGPNASSAAITPSTGVLTNGAVTVSLKAPSTPQLLTITVVVTSSYQKSNQSDNLTYAVQIVQPYALNATLVAASSVSIGPLLLTVTLDGTPIGTVRVPLITAGSTYPIHFAYVDVGLAAGWHTFAISLAQEHGLVTFPGGSEQYAQSFYVSGPPPDYTIWYVAGTVAFVGAVFIWSTRVGARRRGRARK